MTATVGPGALGRLEMRAIRNTLEIWGEAARGGLFDILLSGGTGISTTARFRDPASTAPGALTGPEAAAARMERAARRAWMTQQAIVSAPLFPRHALILYYRDRMRDEAVAQACGCGLRQAQDFRYAGELVVQTHISSLIYLRGGVALRS